jgi:hypothetical protein
MVLSSQERGVLRKQKRDTEIGLMAFSLFFLLCQDCLSDSQQTNGALYGINKTQRFRASFAKCTEPD